MSNAVLSARALVKTYLSGDRRIEVLRGVDLEILASESVSIRGESGSGKSTMLNLLSGLDTPDSGELAWTGAPMQTTPSATVLRLGVQSF